jgi:hypothetical protein
MNVDERVSYTLGYAPTQSAEIDHEKNECGWACLTNTSAVVDSAINRYVMQSLLRKVNQYLLVH